MVMDVVLTGLVAVGLVVIVGLSRRVREIERRSESGLATLAELDRVVRAECVPALTDLARRAGSALDRLDAERAAGSEEITRARDGLAPIVEELGRAAAQLGDARVALAQALERVGTARPVEDPRQADGAVLRDLVRSHLLAMGVGSVTIDGVVSKPDGSQVARARGLRGAELWTGNVVVKGGKVESASALAVRMFP
jgi:hypothetical protein